MKIELSYQMKPNHKDKVPELKNRLTHSLKVNQNQTTLSILLTQT